MKYVKLDVSKPHISLILINTFACWCCEWPLLSLANTKLGMIITATASLGLDLLESWSWENLCFLLDFTLHIHKIGYKLFSSMGANRRLIWGLVLLSCGGWKRDNNLLSLHHTLLAGGQDPGYGMGCTKGTPRGLLGGNNSFPVPSFFFIRSKP